VLVVILAATEAISGVLSGPPMDSYTSMVSVLIVTSAALRNLRSATIRGRLDGSTFRVLALALLAAFSVIFYHVCFQLWRLLFGMRSTSLQAVFIATVAVSAATFAVKASYQVLQEEGLPYLKPPRSRNILAIGYLVTAVHQVVWGGSLLLYSNLKTAGALRCFVLGACAYVCESAASAGSKRLSSSTYKSLNVALAIDSVIRLNSALGAVEPTLASLALPAVTLVSSTGGWLMGKFSRQ
jgi:hypothetical protein